MIKSDFISNLQKYYLGGKCKDVRWEVTGKNLIVDFMTDDGAMLGTVNAVTDFPDEVIAVMNTDRLISLLSALGDQIQGQYKKHRDKITGIEFTDGTTSVYFTTGELKKLPDPNGKIEKYRERGRTLTPEPTIAYEVKLDKESVTRLLKAKKALSDAKIVVLSQGVDSIDFIVNYSERNENKITVPFPATINLETELFAYNVELLCVVLASNDGFREGSLKVAKDGLIVMKFVTEDYEATYYLKSLAI